jgi:hypothetical protein
MKTNKHLLLYVSFSLLLFIVAVVISCNRKFDAPPSYIPPDISANTSIAALKAMHRQGNADSITTDVIIEGVVTANDSSGNFYKQIILQDSTGGIAVNIDDYNLYSSFPIGRKVYVKLDGLFINDDGGLMYIGTSPDAGGKLAGIPSMLKDKYLIKGDLNVPVAPTDVSVDDLKSNNDKYAYMLIRLNNFEVKAADTAKTYANATAKTDASIIVQNCAGDSMVLRNSGYAYFAGIHVPHGNGSLTAIYVYYKSPYNSRITPQIMIRDISDVQFNSTRCDGSAPPPPDDRSELKSIKDIRDMYKGSDIKLGAYKVGGVVISDAANKNISNGAVVLQDGAHGISVYFGGTVNYHIGDSIVLDITGDSLINYNGSLEIKTKYGTDKPTAIATGINIVPRELTIQQLKDNLSDIEGTLVKIKNAAASGNGTYSGSQTLTDASGNITLYTASSSVFAGTTLPVDAKDWVGYGSFYNTTPQLQIRNTNDVTDGNTNPPPASGGSDLLISEYVEGSSNNKYLEIYNAGSTEADLSKYVIKLYANGHNAVHGADNSARLDTISGTATLAPGEMLVYSASNATLALLAGVVAHATKVCNFNGNDAITIEKDGVVIDVFGEIGTDPGNSWTIDGDSKGAVDKTVRRKPGVVQGNTNWSLSAASEWDIISVTDDVSGLGTR